MTRWEYRFTHITNVNFPDGETAQDLVNRLGSDGWELVGFDVHNQAWFKRPLPEVGATETVAEREVAA